MKCYTFFLHGNVYSSIWKDENLMDETKFIQSMDEKSSTSRRKTKNKNVGKFGLAPNLHPRFGKSEKI
jgi:hypothetical protein